MAVSSNTDTVISDVQRKGNVALRLILDGIERAADPSTPKRLGDLRRNKLKQVLGLHATIQWRQRYAARQEDKQHKHYTTPGTGPHFAQKAVKQTVANAATYFRRAGL